MSNGGRETRKPVSSSPLLTPAVQDVPLVQRKAGLFGASRMDAVNAERGAVAESLTRRLTVMRKASGDGAPTDEGAEKAKDASGGGVSQPGAPAEKEADAVADHVADDLHGDKGDMDASAADAGAAGKPGHEKAPAIGAKLDAGVVARMPKWRGEDGDKGGNRGEKGKSFRGGKKKDRDNWYGFDDPEFQQWWHRVGKQEFGGGKDIDNRQQAQAAYNYWVSHGRPRGGK